MGPHEWIDIAIFALQSCFILWVANRNTAVEQIKEILDRIRKMETDIAVLKDGRSFRRD